MHIKEQLASWHLMAVSVFNENDYLFFLGEKDGVYQASVTIILKWLIMHLLGHYFSHESVQGHGT